MFEIEYGPLTWLLTKIQNWWKRRNRRRDMDEHRLAYNADREKKTSQ